MDKTKLIHIGEALGGGLSLFGGYLLVMKLAALGLIDQKEGIAFLITAGGALLKALPALIFGGEQKAA